MRALTPCLALVGGTGMTSVARTEWLMAARHALGDIPADLLARGAKAASLVADHPSKIVPAINAAIRDELGYRQRARRREIEFAAEADAMAKRKAAIAEIDRDVGAKQFRDCIATIEAMQQGGKLMAG